MIVIIGIGKGKSLLFILLVKVGKAGLSVVIVLLNSLRDDIKRRYNKVGIESKEWNSRRLSFSIRIIFVTLESVVTKGFARFIETRKMVDSIDRIVIDECYIILDVDSK